MTKTVLLGTSIVVVFAVLVTSYAYASDGSFLDITSVSVSGNQATITTAAAVNSGQPAGYGYSIVAGNGLVSVTSHAGADDSATQKNANDPSFHVHLLQVGAASAADCPSGAPLKVTAGQDLSATLKIRNTSIQLTNIDTATSGALTTGSVSYLITLENAVCVSPHT